MALLGDDLLDLLPIELLFELDLVIECVDVLLVLGQRALLEAQLAVQLVQALRELLAFLHVELVLRFEVLEFQLQGGDLLPVVFLVRLELVNEIVVALQQQFPGLLHLAELALKHSQPRIIPNSLLLLDALDQLPLLVLELELEHGDFLNAPGDILLNALALKLGGPNLLLHPSDPGIPFPADLLHPDLVLVPHLV
jgi:hypothetical protein